MTAPKPAAPSEQNIAMWISAEKAAGCGHIGCPASFCAVVIADTVLAVEAEPFEVRPLTGGAK